VESLRAILEWKVNFADVEAQIVMVVSPLSVLCVVSTLVKIRQSRSAHPEAMRSEILVLATYMTGVLAAVYI
jgi:hypothetical protein